MNKIFFPTYNGVVVHCSDKKVVSATDCDGKKKLRSYKEKNKIIFWHYPFFRGLQYFFCGIYGFFQALILAYDLCDRPTKTKNLPKHYSKKLVLIIEPFAEQPDNRGSPGEVHQAHETRTGRYGG